MRGPSREGVGGIEARQSPPRAGEGAHVGSTATRVKIVSNRLCNGFLIETKHLHFRTFCKI